ncbi:MAG: hypothetical protein ACM3X9_03455 [Bacillota bacterium]
MKHTAINWRLTGLIVLFGVAFMMAFAGEESGIPVSRFDLGETRTAALFQVSNLLGRSLPSANQSGEFAFRANLGPSPNNGFLNPLQIRPVWERTVVIKETVVAIGFFFAIMIISMFFMFYQNSRTGSEGDETSSGR